jgi:hypothetical protein
MSYPKSFYQDMAEPGTFALAAVGAVNILGQSRYHAVYVEWGADTTAGSIVVEHAPHKDYTGTWKNLATFNWATAGILDAWLGEGAYGAIRVRVATAVAGAAGSPTGGFKSTYIGL